MSEWDQTVREWLIDENHCVAGALANGDTGQVYAAAGLDEDGWKLMWMDDHDVQVCLEDGSEVTVKMNEGQSIKSVVSGERPDTGLYIGGQKFRVVRTQLEFDYNDQNYDMVLCAKPKAGLVMVKTHNGSIVLAMYTEEKGQSQGNTKGAALAFAEFLSAEGY
ncbi:MAG: hypothetical protein KVP17_001139 [Porospora cf. gigantea B]|uniref:uncharacterized protein n=1 Tax=Porospora cf. gigantea B TaxID=2853592 RepID=UPI0035718C70|nr:MAG: hypothetical protein KVP17_001139 [Porospora cf. gigantea B]